MRRRNSPRIDEGSARGWTNLRIVLARQMGALGIILLPLLGLLTAGCLQQDLLEFLVAEVPALAGGP
jgi:hypothetical protein